MAQRILLELLLFLVPFAVFLIYRAASRDLRIRDRWPIVPLVVIGAAIAVLALILDPLLKPRETDKCYTSTRLNAEGIVEPPREIPCTEVTMPGSNTAAPPAGQAPVAPRDRGN
ncbi:MAG: hypothetical protein B7Z38_02160 [Rhodobacterales bacterium 12-64-8]|nr:MAG: hypothetical protein B7Z38_02160 [Rhodobacterales bacterium 12-64-8]OYX51327.1 MAG: hypothetical protein B7Y90_01505 [Alphaproteobacteria bacterium 32-64-14]